jgi:hypothetical protein
LSLHLIGRRFGLSVLKGRRGMLPFLPTVRRSSGFNPIDDRMMGLPQQVGVDRGRSEVLS